MTAIFRIDQKILNPSIENNTWTAPIVYSLYIWIADLLPTTSQLVSMIVVIDNVKQSSIKNSATNSNLDISDGDTSYMNFDDSDSTKIQFKSHDNSSLRISPQMSIRRNNDKSSSSKDL